MQRVDLYLQAIIYQIIADLSDPSANYLVVAKCYFHHDNISYFKPILFNACSVFSIELTDDGLMCSFPGNAENPERIWTIRIPFCNIGKISKCDQPDFITEDTLYLDEEVLIRHYIV